MKPAFLFLAAASALALTPAAAQQRVPSPEQRIERLERQLQQVQRQVFPRGRPAETAGFADEPAATQSSVRNLDERLGALERQLADVLRQAEENGNRARQLESEVARLRDSQEQRISAIEAAQRAAAAAIVAPPVDTVTPPPAANPGGTVSLDPANDPAEAAYDQGYQLWRSGSYSAAITSLKSFTKAYPKHRRTSWANNLIGRAQLDSGQPRVAAETLLANYRTNPKGERAPDSLFYLGQALLKLGQPAQACKAYAELESVYGAKLRDELKRLLPPAKAEAQCG